MSDKAREIDVSPAATKAAEVSWLQTRVILRVIIIVLIVAVTLWIVVKLTGVILLLVLSIFFAYLVSPLVDFLRRPIKLGRRTWEMPRAVAIVVAYLAILAGLSLALLLVVPRLGSQFPEFTEQARAYWKDLGERMQGIDEYFRLHRMPGPLLDVINRAVPSLVERIGQNLELFINAILGWVVYIPWLILIPILSFFLLKDAESFRRSALQMLPRGRWRWRGDEFFQDVSSTLAAYTRAQLTACFFVGLVCALGFALLRMPSPLVLGFIAGVFEFVPLVGPLLIAILAALLATLHAGFLSALLVLLFLGLLRIAQDYFIYPRLIGQGIHLHPLAVIIAILSGAELAGVAGIFLAIPAVAILTVSYRHWLEHRGSQGLADLLDPAPTTHTSASTETAADYPHTRTTPEEMARVRPDLTTGELKKLPVQD